MITLFGRTTGKAVVLNPAYIVSIVEMDNGGGCDVQLGAGYPNRYIVKETLAQITALFAKSTPKAKA